MHTTQPLLRALPRVCPILFLLLGACASEPAVEAIAADAGTAQAEEPLAAGEELAGEPETREVTARQPPADSSIVCRDEARVGTYLKRRRCFTRDQVDRMRESSRDWLRTGGREGSPSVAR